MTALVRGLKWVQSHSPEEIAKVMPEEYALGNKEIYIQSIKSNMPAYSPDGKFIPGAAETALKVLQGVRSERAGQDDRPVEDVHEQVRRQGERGELNVVSRTRCSAA